MKGLTERQREVLDYIKSFIRSQKYPPSIREIADNFKISVKGGYDHLKALEKKKYVKCNMNRSRAIEIIGEDGFYEEERHEKIPLLGTVAAGTPLFAEENSEGSIEFPVSYLRGGKHFALRVKGDSMKDVGILAGDIAIVRQQNSAENGDIVVALVDDAATIKKFYLEKNRVQLKSENPAYPPIYTQDIRILGKLSFLIRNYE